MATGLTVLVALVATGCDDAGRRTSSSAAPAATAPGSPSASTDPAPSDPRRAAVEALLVDRARATLAHDRRGFLAGVGAPHRAAQVAWFERYRSLPLASFSYDVGMPDVSVRDADRFVAEVDELVQLGRFDEQPVSTEHRMEFRRLGGRWRVVADVVSRDEVSQAPWDLPGVHVAFRGHFGVVTDDGSASHAPELLTAAEAALEPLQQVLPDHTDAMLLIAFSDPGAFRTEGIDLAEVAQLGGIAVDVRNEEGEAFASRALLSPSMLTESSTNQRIVIRHEFTHVALHALDRVPAWVTEGIADYYAWLPEPDTYLADGARQAAERGIDAMPDNVAFRRDMGTNYGIAWASLLWLAERYGPEEPLALMTALQDAHAEAHADADVVLEERYHLTVDDLAGRGGDLIRASFD
ncbi:hypothetical protein H5V45_02495 [Nocardioides sp. KIGAM211]|uniref:Peptidase MA-like domain-containing protein n=1 Tax=Nocardioides luti TaxID=2761101 RepID=A0A7X0RDC0_9ACTN|nr:hypothetical protein [Nocardioides luti]MBB6626181.1 hypothetical protein [Nocardioides luti]